MINQLYGSFTADGNNKVLEMGVQVEWLELYNYTQSLATNNGYGYQYYWQRGMGTANFRDYHPAGDTTAARTINTTGVNWVDSSDYTIGANVVVTGGTNATQPVYSTGTTTGLSTGTVVRVNSIDQVNLHGMDFTIDNVIGSTSFRMQNALATAPGIIAGAGNYRIIAPNREVYDAAMSQNKVGGYMPGKRRIVNITQAASAVVTVSVDHGYQVGQQVRLNVPSYYGMVEMNGLVGTITAITAGTFTVDINSSAFTAFQFPVYTVPEFVDAYSIPNGDTTTLGFDGSTRNTGFKGFILDAGTTAPGGNNADVIYWRAGKAASVV